MQRIGFCLSAFLRRGSFARILRAGDPMQLELAVCFLLGCAGPGVQNDTGADTSPDDAARTCELVTRPSGEPTPTSGWMGCRQNAECVAGVEGRCRRAASNLGVCTYHDCETDGDCAPGERCYCASGNLDRNTCVEDLCTGSCPDYECEPSPMCAGIGGLRLGLLHVACRTEDDTCTPGSCEPGTVCSRTASGVTADRFECLAACSGD